MEFKKKYHKYKFKYLNEKNYQKSLTFIDNSDQITKFNNKNLEKKTLTNTNFSIFKKNEYLSKYSKKSNIIKLGNLFNITGGGITESIQKLPKLDMDKIKRNKDLIIKKARERASEQATNGELSSDKVNEFIDNNKLLTDNLLTFFSNFEILIKELKKNYNDNILTKKKFYKIFIIIRPIMNNINMLMEKIPRDFLGEYGYFANLYISTITSLEAIRKKIFSDKTKITHPPSDTSSDEYEDGDIVFSTDASEEKDIDASKNYSENYQIVQRQVEKKETKLKKFVHDKLLSDLSDSSDLKQNSKVLVELCKKKDANNEDFAKYYDFWARDLKKYCSMNQTADDYIKKCDEQKIADDYIKKCKDEKSAEDYIKKCEDEKSAEDYIKKCEDEKLADESVEKYIQKCNELLDAAHYVEKCNESKSADDYIETCNDARTVEDYKEECDKKKETLPILLPVPSSVPSSKSSTDESDKSKHLPPIPSATKDQSIEYQEQDESDVSEANENNNFFPLMNERSFYEKYLKKKDLKNKLTQSEQQQLKNRPGVKIIYK